MKTLLTVIGALIAVVVAIFAVALISALVIMYAWNLTIPFFGGPAAIPFSVAFGAMLLLGIVKNALTFNVKVG